jgi:hypothetical protein
MSSDPEVDPSEDTGTSVDPSEDPEGGASRGGVDPSESPVDPSEGQSRAKVDPSEGPSSMKVDPSERQGSGGGGRPVEAQGKGINPVQHSE